MVLLIIFIIILIIIITIITFIIIEKCTYNRLKLLLSILFILIRSPICFNLFSFYWHIFFSGLIPALCLLRPVKGISLQPSSIFQMLSLYLIFTSIVIYTSLHCVKSIQIRSFFWPVLFKQCYLHSLVYTYLYLLIHTYVLLFILLYEFDKIDKIWKIQKLRHIFLD